ncbi:MAG: SDR family NAD(P)-dependent oxidoreductase [Bacteroidia bacterium]|nr:SDR family NAD(P)-dependent oxidoreductase [Bacteroidia bacterium]
MVFVTGGTGLVGSRIIRDLTGKGIGVRALKRKESNLSVFNRQMADAGSRRELVEWVVGDVNDLFSIEDALEGIDEVYHAASIISFQSSDFRRMMKINVEGTANMVNASLEKGIKKFCFISSVSAIGRNETGGEVNENNVWKTSKRNTGYAISKYCSEREVWRGMEEGLHAVIVNPSIIIGPGDWRKGSSYIFSQVWKGLKFYTENTTGFVDVRDVSVCAIRLMKKNISGQRYILNSENLDYRTVLNDVADRLGKSRPTIKATPFLSEIAWRLENIRYLIGGGNPIITKETVRNAGRSWYYSNEKIRKELGVNFIPVRSSIGETAAIFLKEYQSR